MANISVIRADITTLEVDAIVNAANERMRGGGGVDGAVHRAAGIELLQACMQFDGCPTGEVRVTPGFRLPAKYVIHAVGPVWHGGEQGEPDLLASCYSSSIKVALELGLKSMAFSAISTGVYGYPPQLAAAVAVQAIRSALADAAALAANNNNAASAGSRALPQSLTEVYLVAFSDQDFASLQSALEGSTF